MLAPSTVAKLSEDSQMPPAERLGLSQPVGVAEQHRQVVEGLHKGRRSMGFQGIFYANYLQLTVLIWNTQEPCLT